MFMGKCTSWEQKSCCKEPPSSPCLLMLTICLLLSASTTAPKSLSTFIRYLRLEFLLMWGADKTFLNFHVNSVYSFFPFLSWQQETSACFLFSHLHRNHNLICTYIPSEWSKNRDGSYERATSVFRCVRLGFTTWQHQIDSGSAWRQLCELRSQ